MSFWLHTDESYGCDDMIINYEGDAFICEVIDSGHFVWTRGH